jgi:ParB/RepB/Spo0J family partition protein
MGKNAGAIERLTMAVDQLVENPRNPRKHPQEQIDRLVASYKRFGQTKPILVRKADRVIIAGHGMLRAMKQAGAAQVDVLAWETDQATADQYMLADNRHGELSSPDTDRVAAILREIDKADYMAVGFSDDEVSKLLADLDASDIVVAEVDTSAVDDRAWVSIRCPLARQAEMLQRLTEVMADYPDVEVDLGTVAVAS